MKKDRANRIILDWTEYLNPRDAYNTAYSPSFGRFAGPEHRIFDTFWNVIN